MTRSVALLFNRFHSGRPIITCASQFDCGRLSAISCRCSMFRRTIDHREQVRKFHSKPQFYIFPLFSTKVVETTTAIKSIGKNRTRLLSASSTEDQHLDQRKNNATSSEEQPEPINVTVIDETEEEVEKDSKRSMLDIEDRSTYTEEIKVRMPDISGGEGKILKWYKQEGDVVQWEDVLCDIETEDFTFGMETEDDNLAIMGKILVDAPSGPIKANEVICILFHPKKDDDSKKNKNKSTNDSQ